MEYKYSIYNLWFLIPLEEAIKISQDIIKNPNRKFMREETNTYRFRNISKQKFNKFFCVAKF
jgi:hypothetical protein